MTLHNYFHLLDSTHKQLFINFNWQILKSKNNSSILTDLTQSELLEIFSLFDYQLPDYQKGDFFQDISLINSLGGLLGFNNSILNHLFDFFIEKEITLAKKDVYDYHDHTAYQFQSVNHILDNFTQQPITPFTKRFIDKENKVLSITTNKIFADAQIILGKIIETPHEFANFISLFNKNQNIFLNDDIIKLRNINVEQQLVLNTWIEQHEIYDFNEFNSLARNSRRIFEDEQYLIYMKICSFFIAHPKIYRDQAQMIFPPIFIFLEKLNYQDKYQFFAQLTTEHLNTIMISHHNKFFSSFVENFTGLSIVSRNQYSEEFKYIAHYLEKQFTKDLPFNKLIDLSNLFPRDLDDKSLTIEDNLFENIFRQQSINNICLKDYADILKNRNQH